MSAFDAEQFMNQEFSEANDTKSIPCPEGDYLGLTESAELRSWVSKKDPSKSGLTLDIAWIVEDEGVKQELNRDKVVVRQGIMLDLTPEGNLDMGKGKNIQLGKLREALGLNVAGQPFSFNMIPGHTARISVKHDDPDQNDNIFAKVRAVAPLD